MLAKIKTSILGYTKVGKSSFVFYLFHKQSYENTLSTIGASYSEYNYKNKKFQLWDTAGEEKYRALLQIYFRGANIALLLYDITNPKTFEEVKTLQMSVNDANEGNCFFMLIGNKSDLSDKRKVSFEEGSQYALEIKAPFLEVSCSNGEGVFESMELMYRGYLEYSINNEKTQKLKINEIEINKDKPSIIPCIII